MQGILTPIPKLARTSHLPRRIAQDHDQKRTAILRAAARLFADEGYGRASMAQIASVCGISKANIYHYYPSKEALLFDMLDTHLRALRDLVANLAYPNEDPREKLHVLMTEILLSYQGADAEHDVLLNTTSALSGEQQAHLRNYQRDILGSVRSLLEKLVPSEVAQDRTKMRVVTNSVVGMLNWHYKWCNDADDATRRSQARTIAQLAIGGISNLH
jgi:AcrR family transcriptional regulator